MTELQRLIEKVWPLKEKLVLTDGSCPTLTAANNALWINDTIRVEWDDKGYGISSWKDDWAITFGKFDPAEMVMLAIQAYVKHVVGEDLGKWMDAEQEQEEPDAINE